MLQRGDLQSSLQIKISYITSVRLNVVIEPVVRLCLLRQPNHVDRTVWVCDKIPTNMIYSETEGPRQVRGGETT